MIETPLPSFQGMRLPAWLDPGKLGANRLRVVGVEKTHVISGGQPGLAAFLKNVDKTEPLLFDSEAFVVLSRDLERQYVFSREQFWLAASGLVDTSVRSLLRKNVLGGCRDFLRSVPRYPSILALDDPAAE